MNIGETANKRNTIKNNRINSSFVVAEVTKDHYLHFHENIEQSIRNQSAKGQQITDKTQPKTRNSTLIWKSEENKIVNM